MSAGAEWHPRQNDGGPRAHVKGATNLPPTSAMGVWGMEVTRGLHAFTPLAHLQTSGFRGVGSTGHTGSRVHTAESMGGGVLLRRAIAEGTLGGMPGAIECCDINTLALSITLM